MSRILASFVLVPMVESWVCTVTCPSFVEDDCRCHDAGSWAMWVCTKKAGVAQAQPWFCSQPSCQCNRLETTSTLAHLTGSGNASATPAVPATTAPPVQAQAPGAPPCGTPCGAPAALAALPGPARAPRLPATPVTPAVAAAAAAASKAAPKEAAAAIIVESSDLQHVQRAFLESSPRLRQPVRSPAAVLLGITVFAAMVSLVSFCRGNRSQQAEAHHVIGTMRESEE